MMSLTLLAIWYESIIVHNEHKLCVYTSSTENYSFMHLASHVLNVLLAVTYSED